VESSSAFFHMINFNKSRCSYRCGALFHVSQTDGNDEERALMDGENGDQESDEKTGRDDGDEELTSPASCVFPFAIDVRMIIVDVVDREQEIRPESEMHNHRTMAATTSYISAG
jgi:hypothetical protein